MEHQKVRKLHDEFVLRLPSLDQGNKTTRCLNVYWTILDALEGVNSKARAAELFTEIMHTAHCDQIRDFSEVRYRLVEDATRGNERILTDLAGFDVDAKGHITLLSALFHNHKRIRRQAAAALPPLHRLYYHTLFKAECFFLRTVSVLPPFAMNTIESVRNGGH